MSHLLDCLSRTSSLASSLFCLCTRLAARHSGFVLGALFLTLAAPISASAQRGVAISYLADETAAIGIEQAAAPDATGLYKGYVPSFMAFSALPKDFNGAVWLRFTLNTSFEKPVSALRVDLGSDPPGITRLFIPQGNGTFSVTESTPNAGVFIVPDSVPFPDVFYARVDGTPGLWFRPVLGPAEEGALNIPLRLILGGIFAAAMLILLFQYIRKAEEWRVWAAVTAGCGVVAAILPPNPAAGAAFTPLAAAGMLMPGLFLMLFVHTVRHLFDTPRTMPGCDKLLIIMYLVGGGVALLPFAPGFLWTTRYLPLFAILLLPLLPLAMVALARSLRGCSLFFCACLLPIAGAAASSWELTAPGPLYLAGSGSLWGLALALLLLAFVPSEPPKAVAETEDDVFDSLNRALSRYPTETTTPDALKTSEPLQPGFLPFDASHAVTHPCDAATRDETTFTPAIPVEPDIAPDDPDDVAQPLGEFPALSLFGESPEEPTPATPAPGTLLSAAPDLDAGSRPAEGDPLTPDLAPLSGDDALPIPDSALGRLPAFSADPAQPAEAPLAVTTPESGSSARVIHIPVEAIAAPAPESSASPLPDNAADAEEIGEATPDATFAEAETAPSMERRGRRRILFDLPLLIKNTYDALAPLCEKKNVGMTWFIAPQTGRLFEGEAELLESALLLLLRDMVETVEHGNVRLNVRRLPDNCEGHLVFTIAEWDAKQVSAERKIAGLAEAWTLAERTGGIFSVEHSPGGGTTVIFSTVFTALDKAGSTDGKTARDTPPLPLKTPETEAAKAERDTAGTPEHIAARQDAPAVQVFADYPDIAIPEPEVPSPAVSPTPFGVDGNGLREEHATERASHRIIVADMAASSRARTANIFAGTEYSVLECASPADARALYVHHPAALVVMNADMPEVDILAAIKEIHADDAANGRSPVHAVVLVGYAAQGDRLLRAGCSRAVMKKAMEDELLAVVEELIPIRAVAKEDAPPVPAAAETSADEQHAPGMTVPGTDAPATADSAPERHRSGPETATPENLLDEALADIPPIALPDGTADSNPGPEAADLLRKDEKTPLSIVESGIFASVLPPENAVTPERKVLRTPPVPPTTNRPVSSGGLGLLDMIVTDEESIQADPPLETPVQRPAPATCTARFSSTPPASGRNDPPAPAPATRNTPTKNVRVVVRPLKKGNEAKENPGALAFPKASAAHHAGANAADVADTDAQTKTAAVAALAPDKDAVSQVREMVENLQTPATVSIPLPDEEDSVFKDMVPLIPGLIVELTDAMNDAARGQEEKSPLLVQEAAERVAGKAESFGLTRLERIARCVERAAAADDIEPMECVLADLESWVERYKKALRQLHHDVLW